MYTYKVKANERLLNFHTVVKYWEGKDASGGPVVAYFTNEKDAKEYADFKQKQLENGK